MHFFRPSSAGTLCGERRLYMRPDSLMTTALHKLLTSINGTEWERKKAWREERRLDKKINENEKVEIK